MQETPRSFIFSVLKPFKGWILIPVLVAVTWAVDLSLRPYILKVLIDKLQLITPQEAYAALSGPALFYVALSIFHGLMFRLYDYSWLNINPPLKKVISLKLMDRMFKHSHSLYQNYFAGSLGNKIKEAMSGIPDLLKLLIDHFLSHFLALFIAAVTLWTINSRFAIGLIIWVGLFVGGSLRFSKKAQKLSQASAEERSNVIGQIVDILSNIMTVRLFTGKSAEKKHLNTNLDLYVAADQKRDWFFLKMFFFQGSSFVIYQAICLLWLIMGYKEGYVTVGDFALVITLNISIIDSFWTIARDIGQFSENLGNITQGLQIALSKVEVVDKIPSKELKIQKGQLIFENVHFHYSGASPLFDTLSITIPPLQKVGLVGYSGSGKSTFANLLLRMFDIKEGRILIDGQNIQDVSQKSLRAHISMVPQDPSLFHRSLLENIRYGKLEASAEEVIEAAKKAHAHNFIEELPEKYNTLVGERGVKLSGGQRQRIAIARAFLKDAPIFILDEATSQLDSVIESEIQESLRALMHKKTTLVIAHRLSTLLDMDRLLVFNQGKIVEDGTHKDLLAKRGLYKTLWDAQVGGFLPEKQSI